MKHRIWAISDIHLPHGTMNAYGAIWQDHDSKILGNILNLVQPKDILLIPGDIINCINEKQAEESIEFFSKIPCTIIICPGNHDIWLSPDKKTKKAVRPQCLPKNVILLDGDCITIGDTMIGGLMFWCFKDAFPWEGHVGIIEKLQKHQSEALSKFNFLINQFQKETGVSQKILISHFPPISDLAVQNLFTPSITKAGINLCLYGHAHGVTEKVPGCDATIDNVRYRLVSADYLNLMPVHVADYAAKV